MVITEIFRSIQGESTFAGLPCVFVRLTGCNLRCRWCDTAYAFHGGRKMEPEEILAEVRAHGGKLVEITGGEPLLQREIVPFTKTLLEEDYKVLLETSGAQYVGELPQPVVKIVDVKCPGSGEAGKFCMENLKVLDGKDQLKFVIRDREDYRYAKEFLQEHRQECRVEEKIFSPVFGALDPRRLAEWLLADGLEVRLGLQLHKLIWDEHARGV